MGLATRCTACGTVFRVVPDQLRVSDGWVRCGRCAEVFNAAAHLLDIESGTPRRSASEQPAEPPPARHAEERLYDPAYDGEAEAAEPVAVGPPNRMHAQAHHAPADGPGIDTEQVAAHGTLPDERPDDARLRAVGEALHAQPMLDADGPRVGQPSAALAGWRDSQPSGHGALADEEQFTHGGNTAGAGAGGTSGTSGTSGIDGINGTDGVSGRSASPPSAAALQTDSMAADRTPSFVRRADRAQRWQRPRVRAALWAVVVLAGLGLAGQAAHTYRDLAAARFPVLRPALERACGWLRCSVGEAHAINSLVVESSGLVRVEKSSIYRLSVALRNRAAIAVAVPAVEIALTDGQGKLLARRVLRAAELGASQPALAAGGDLALQATLQAATEPVAGYTIELFYP